jgi:low affinity Fe/Cu permease
MLHAKLGAMVTGSNSARRAAPPPDEEQKRLSDVFRRLASSASDKFGSHWAFLAAVSVVVAWAVTGPIFGFSEAWQLVINTGTTIITFLMVFLIQATQNRDAKATHLKLDELIRSSEARNIFADLEDATEAELAEFQREFEQLRKSGKRMMAAASEARERTFVRAEDSPETAASDGDPSESHGGPTR